MFHVVLYQPEIPPNAGNVMRLCTNTGARLHLIEPLGFAIDDRRLRRAGLDYRARTVFDTWPDFDTFLARVAPRRLHMFTRHGRTRYDRVAFAADDALVFGPETRGLPASLIRRGAEEGGVYLPMQPDNRSINLGNVVSIALYEAWRQNAFEGSENK